MRCDGEDFVIAIQPEDEIIFRTKDARALRNLWRHLRWQIAIDTTLSIDVWTWPSRSDFREHRADQPAPFVRASDALLLKPSVPAPKVRSCFEFASDLRDVAALKARACKFVLRRHAATVRFSDRGCAVRRTPANLIHCALPLK
jgi:hypothetical protein